MVGMINVMMMCNNVCLRFEFEEGGNENVLSALYIIEYFTFVRG